LKKETLAAKPTKPPFSPQWPSVLFKTRQQGGGKMGSLHRPAFHAALKLLGYTWLHSCFVLPWGMVGILFLGNWQ
jgi:hypothetical protein